MSAQKKHNLQLPQTGFQMKANLPEKEPEFIAFWREHNIYQKLISKNKGKSLFSFVDGPPYANGHLHIGHALNKILKDIVVKYINLSGKNCPFVPVWDCHGLPIELAALKKIKKEKDLSPAQIRKHCHQEALFWVEKQKEGFQRLGVLADWPHPLLTLSPEYSAGEVRALAEIAKKNLLYRGKKPVYWCYALRTAIASSEVEYREHKSPSVYVRFAFPAPPAKWQISKACSFVIWTTTPWTLPANQALCLKADFTYAVFDTGKECLILAEDLKESFEKHTNIFLKKVLSFKGKDLERQKARHPFMNRDSLIIMGDHVTKEEGTGCVHTAPGHGLEDFIIGKKYNLPVFVPVDEAGRFTAEVPEWEGINVFKANPLIIEKLKSTTGPALISEQEITHNYPYNPRSGRPLIFRATDQWFIQFERPEYSVRKKSLSAVEKDIQFFPDWGRQRLKAMIKSSPDWCLSRQRHWGVPIPVFYCKKCERPLMDAELMQSIADQMETSGQGIEYWFSTSAKDLIPKNTACPDCQSADFKKGKDILDVWFDSGVCHHVFKSKYGKDVFPADIYLEGSDQHRGWFQTSLNSSVCLTGKSPFRSLVTHCFVNDAEGYKMSKSRGNVLNLKQLIQQRGAEILRLWVCSEDYSQDLQVSKEIFDRVSETYRRLRNTIRFMLGNLFDFDPEKNLKAFSDLKQTDQWILCRLKKLVQQSKTHYESFAFHKIYQELNMFFTTDLSSLYLDILKDRLYTFKKNGPERRSAQSALYLLLKNLLRLMSPITSFLSEEAYHYLPGKKMESVLLEGFPVLPAEWSLSSETQEKFRLFLEIRRAVQAQTELIREQKQIGSSLETRVVLSLPPEILQKWGNSPPDDLREFLIVSQVELKAGGRKWQAETMKAKGEKCDRCWNYSESLNNQKICFKCINNLP